MDSNEKKREFLYVYFIENHINTSKVIIDLSKEIKGVEDLQIVDNNTKEQKNKTYVYNIYRFKLIPSKLNNRQIIIKLRDENDNEFKSKLIINNINFDNFIFDFKFKLIIGWILVTSPPESFKFNLIEEFEIYLQYIRKKLNIKKKDIQNTYFILSVHELFKKKKTLLNFLFI